MINNNPFEDINDNKGINITKEKENVVYYVAERNTPFVHIVRVG